jgi:anhydro-N-acetylmuramic acid kinase
MRRGTSVEKGLERPIAAIGLMSGTSLDGIDAALIATDGVVVEATGTSLTIAYEGELRERLRGILGSRERTALTAGIEKELTLAHAEAVKRLLDLAGLRPGDIGVVGFHGQTILHAPEDGLTWQIGDGALLAAETGIDVVCDFRSADMEAGGEGAPLAPAYHRALAHGLEGPVAVLNVGGVANVTWIGDDGSLLAFDTGPGNALIDDWVMLKAGVASDLDGQMARAGRVAEALLNLLMANPYFDRHPPKSLDRNAFDISLLDYASQNDGAATLTAFTAASVACAAAFFPAPAKRWLVTGGGRLNPALMDELGGRLGVPVDPVEVAGWDGDALEAQAFGYLAVRSLAGLPLSFPTTTGAALPTAGGRIHKWLGQANPY